MEPNRLAIFRKRHLREWRFSRGQASSLVHSLQQAPPRLISPMCCIVTLELSDSANIRFMDHMAENGWTYDADGLWRNERHFAGRRFSEPEARSAELRRFFGPEVHVGLVRAV